MIDGCAGMWEGDEEANSARGKSQCWFQGCSVPNERDRDMIMGCVGSALCSD